MIELKAKGSGQGNIDGIYTYAGTQALAKDVECLVNTFNQVGKLDDMKITIKFRGDLDGDKVQPVD